MKGISLAELVKFEPNELPERGFDVDTLNDLDRYNHDQNESRKTFYEHLSRSLPNEPLIYYPGSGADPVPEIVFGSGVVYGSLRDSNYIGLLKKTDDSRALAYHGAIDKYGPFDDIKMIYANVLNSPFGSIFDLLVINGLPSQVLRDKRLISELDRLIEEGGLLVIEDVTTGIDGAGNVIHGDDDLFLDELIRFGFTNVFNTTLCSSITYVTSEAPSAWYSGKKYATSSLGGWLVNKSEFMEAVKKGESCRIFASESRVFRKPR